MSRERTVYQFAYYSFPRVSGDEPWISYWVAREDTFSPRERG